MRLGVPEHYRCDGCRLIALGWTHLLPEGWRAIRWNPGILEPSGVEKVPTKHVCSDGCRTKIMSEINAKRGAG